MKRIITSIAMMAALISLPAFVQAQEKLPAAEEILARYVKVTGGAQAYKNIKSMKTTAELSIPEANLTGGTIESILSIPGKVNSVATIPGIGEIKRGSNGETCWEMSAIQGARVVEGKEAEFMLDESNMEKVYDFKNYYKEMKTVGVEEFNGEKCYKVELTNKKGVNKTAWYSVKTGLEVRSVQTLPSQMGNIEIDTRYFDYKEVDGLKTPFRVEQKAANMTQVIETTGVKYNVELSDDKFKLPTEIQKIVDFKAKKKSEDK